MKTLSLPNDEAPSSWLSPTLTALALALVVLLLLALVNRRPGHARALADPGTVTFGTVDVPDNAAASQDAPSQTDLSAMLPTPVSLLSPRIDLEPQPLEVSLNATEMIEKRYSYSDLGRISSHHGRFGLSGLSDIDEPVQSVFIPPNTFPQSLVAEGVREGKATVVIEIDEQGRAKVRRVLNSSHPELIAPIVESMNQARYSAPLRHGKPTKVVLTRVVLFSAAEHRRGMQDATPSSSPAR
jgi:hypothetical protein